MRLPLDDRSPPRSTASGTARIDLRQTRSPPRAIGGNDR